MLDPLTALGLASSIVQLITFTSDLVAKGRDIYQSADGALVENLELEAITKSLRDLSLEVEPPVSGGNLTKVDRQLQQLCTGCRKVADELLDVIQKLKTHGPHKRWTSFRQALDSVWREDVLNLGHMTTCRRCRLHLVLTPPRTDPHYLFLTLYYPLYSSLYPLPRQQHTYHECRPYRQCRQSRQTAPI